MPRCVHTFVATWFGTGLAPIAPGTVGSLAALPFAYVIHNAFGAPILAVAALFIFIMGIWVSDIYMELHDRKDDPKEVVIDEVAGMWLLLVFVPPTMAGYLVAFILFRIYDIAKPWPISWFDERFKSGFGVMFDDIIAAIFGILTYVMLETFASGYLSQIHV